MDGRRNRGIEELRFLYAVMFAPTVFHRVISLIQFGYKQIILASRDNNTLWAWEEVRNECFWSVAISGQ